MAFLAALAFFAGPAGGDLLGVLDPAGAVGDRGVREADGAGVLAGQVDDLCLGEPGDLDLGAVVLGGDDPDQAGRDAQRRAAQAVVDVTTGVGAEEGAGPGAASGELRVERALLGVDGVDLLQAGLDGVDGALGAAAVVGGDLPGGELLADLLDNLGGRAAEVRVGVAAGRLLAGDAATVTQRDGEPGADRLALTLEPSQFGVDLGGRGGGDVHGDLLCGPC
jgi:hypothetical protein